MFVFILFSCTRLYSSINALWPVYTRGDTRASSASPLVWATATCASDRHPVIDEVAIHRHPASYNIGASLSGQLSVIRWSWVCSLLPHHLSLCFPVTSRDGQNHHMLMILNSNRLNKWDLKSKSFCKWWFENQNHIKNQMIWKSKSH